MLKNRRKSVSRLFQLVSWTAADGKQRPRKARALLLERLRLRSVMFAH